jgi:hypothetical protein
LNERGAFLALDAGRLMGVPTAVSAVYKHTKASIEPALHAGVDLALEFLQMAWAFQ